VRSRLHRSQLIGSIATVNMIAHGIVWIQLLRGLLLGQTFQVEFFELIERIHAVC
jgi:hypothetical protein